MILFFDANALIYFIEGAEPFATRTRSALATLITQHRTLGAAVSRLSWLECRVQPLRDNELEVLSAFDTFFSRPDLKWVELTQQVVELATAIRVKHGLRTPDALQAASCLQLGAQHVFLTGDKAFKKVSGLNAQILS
jgi:predicted nucleic acid-binding protein